MRKKHSVHKTTTEVSVLVFDLGWIMNQLHKGWSESQIHSMDDLDVYITDGIKYRPTSLPLSNQRPFRLKIQREDNLMKYTSRSEGGMDWRLPLVFSNKKVSGALNTSNRQADACQKYSSSPHYLKFSKRRRHIFGCISFTWRTMQSPMSKNI